jgi:tRNA A-37 threonylcarbamoyl transferase component Bud32
MTAFPALCIAHNDVFCKNICVKDGVLYLIDFGLAETIERKNNSMIKAIKKEL